MIERVTVEYQRYKTSDDKLFETKEDAEFHEKKLNGAIRTCKECNGTKKVDPYGDGRQWITCGTCSGKGYVEKVEVWK